jgi:tetratricopeptide (TPR) repeat protein
MQPHRKTALYLVLLLSCSLLLPHAIAQTPDQNYQAERKKATDLFNENKNLEALPLFEDLVKQRPDDDPILVGLAGCLVSHSATLDDEDAAARERVRARELLLKAKDLGTSSTLMLNLLQMIPADGRIPYSQAAADQALRKAEAAFARNDFQEAIRNYSRALELDPKNYSAALYIGDSYFGAKDWPKAAEWYQRAIQINPDAETAYRYYADMLTKNGEMEKARKLAIQAVVADPYNPVTWRGLEQWAKTNQLALNSIQIKVPKDSVSQTGDKQINITVDPSLPKDTAAVWLAYSLSRAKWRGDEFKKHFPRDKQYRHSLKEEAEALTTAAKVCTELAQSNAKQEGSSARPKDPDLLLLLRLYNAQMIEPYVLLNAADQGIAQDYAGYREKSRSKLETYLNDFVVPSSPQR